MERSFGGNMSIHATNPPSWTVVVDGTTELKLDESDFGRDRIDLIFELDGEIAAVKGEVNDGPAAMFPEVPILPPDARVIAQVHVKGGSTYVGEHDITIFSENTVRTGEIPITGQGVYLDTDDPFDRILIPIIEMNRKKRADYANPLNLYANFDKNAIAMDLPGYGPVEDCLSMILRKAGRIANLRGKAPNNETVQDSWLDLAVYAILGLGLAQREATRVEEVVKELDS
jgi:hypothetical protein